MNNVEKSKNVLNHFDFMEIDHIYFPTEGSKLTPPTNLGVDFVFKDYSKHVFHLLRKRFSIDPATYMTSLSGDLPFVEFSSNSKSGQFFFFSHDQRYVRSERRRLHLYVVAAVPTNVLLSLRTTPSSI